MAPPLKGVGGLIFVILELCVGENNLVAGGW